MSDFVKSKNNSYVPIFIIVHNRYEILKKSVESYEKYIKTPYKLVFHNVASTYEPTLNYLNERKKKGDTVYDVSINNHLSVIDTVKKYLKEHTECKYYVITDPDVELDNVNGDILEFYQFLVEKYNIVSAGPMLRIDDIPDHYPLKETVIKKHTECLWIKIPKTVCFRGVDYKYINCAIDTTFQLLKSNVIPSKFPVFNSIRCYAPYSARHLDWYLDPKNLSPCQQYYAETASRVSHWAVKKK